MVNAGVSVAPKGHARVVVRVADQAGCLLPVLLWKLMADGGPIIISHPKLYHSFVVAEIEGRKLFSVPTG